ncbi:MAG TPA: flagellar hook-basal body complex protein FliE [Candidatus Acidoferrales bacterium]|nr:flagellar hook-basal body complex protein FliE [Candidatus Acidoferrales bacterium]
MRDIGGIGDIDTVRQNSVPRPPMAVADTDTSLSFAHVLKQGIDAVNTQQQQATALAKEFEAGQDGVDLSEVMIASQKAGLAFRALTQIRNQVVSAYQDVMRMTI